VISRVLLQTTFRLLKLLVATHNRKVQAELDATIDAIHATHVRCRTP
jgi:hypothetical protein